MKKHTLAVSERTLDLLQNIDYTFSQINKVLRELNNKILLTNNKTKENIEKLKPWFNFFSIDVHEAAETEEKIDEKIEIKTEEKIEKSYSSEIRQVKNNETSSDLDVHLPQLRLNKLYEDSSPRKISSERTGDIIEQIYNFINKNQLVSLDSIYEAFKEHSNDKLDSYIEILIEKRVLGCRDSTFYIK
ncbi:hypothetical protein M153_9004000587 [Pseudoloma neurophilia]|uniref:Uncharacterized protein n=1 Tax=Pseudoloma neurophilia TaxID=146866 RepID=A0A0R0M1M5_9MICR|nr:hypothetical protein M153_9004000587 [Pseudoloma neurophilia]